MTKTSKADLIAALKSIALIDQAYRGSHGMEVVIKEMKRTAVDALEGRWAGVSRLRVHSNGIKRGP